VNADNGDYQDYPFRRKSSEELSESAPGFPVAVRALDRLIEKARRFYQSGDFEEVVLNAHLIKELFELCIREEYRRQGRCTFRETLRIQIEKKADLLDYWWNEGIIAFQKIKVGPEIAKLALASAEDMYEYIASYVDYRSGIVYADQISLGPHSYGDRANKKIASSPPSAYLVTKGGLKIADAEVLYLARPSILGCALEYKVLELLLAVLLFGSFFIGALVKVSQIAVLLRAISVLLFLFVAVRTGIATYSEKYAVTARSIHIEKGLFLKHTVAIPLSRVAKVAKQQGLSGKLSKTGNLNITTSTGHLFVFKEIYDPDDVCDLISELRAGSESVTTY
jgi:membrane protein YdbS with pleckstrin-like domain